MLRFLPGSSRSGLFLTALLHGCCTPTPLRAYCLERVSAQEAAEVAIFTLPIAEVAD